MVSKVQSVMDRRRAVAKLLESRNGALIVTGLGSLTGLGLAQAQPEKRVMVITGDGEMLMALGSLATISVAKPKNLDIIVLDNQHYGETGMQRSHTGMGINIATVANAVGFDAARTLHTLDEVDLLLAYSHASNIGRFV